MNNRDRALAVLRYQPYDRLPLVHFGFLHETLELWHRQGYITAEETNAWDETPEEDSVAEKLGFDFGWQTMFQPSSDIFPFFERKVEATLPDGSEHVRNGHGVLHVNRPGAGSIHAEMDHLLKDRRAWEEHFKPRLQWTPDRVNRTTVRTGSGRIRFDGGGLELLASGERTRPLGLYCGSLYGLFRNWVGIEATCYMLVDDEPLFDEIINTIADLCCRNVEFALASGARFDFAHFWEDICFKNGPLVSPSVFAQKVGPHYKRITTLCRKHGIDVISLDCDGWIDALLPVWLENGVNTMFPIECGTWNASIAPWREKYGRGLLGVGGLNKRVFSRDKAAVDAEVERLRPLVDLGGYLPCPDHRLPEDCKFDLVRHYCDRMRGIFG